MPAADIDAYLRDVDEPKRSTLEALRRTILVGVHPLELLRPHLPPVAK